MKKEQYDSLSEIAKVVAQPKGHADYAAPWQAMTRQIGKALGKEDETEKLNVLGVDRLVRVTSSTEANDRIKAEPLLTAVK